MNSFAVVLRRGKAAVPAIWAAVFAVGCGGSGGPPAQPVAIVVHPVNQFMPIGQTATFKVIATGTEPISYQWSENGTAIPGATGASYTTPPVALGANGSTSMSFQVAVSNAVNSVTSNAVTLTAGPRSPKPGDVRYLPFQQVSLPGFMGSAGGLVTNVIGGVHAPNALGLPMLGNNPGYATWCMWHVNIWALPPPMTGLSWTYQVGSLPAAAYVQSLEAPGVVINSLDIEPTCNGVAPGAVGVAFITSSQGGFDLRLEVVPAAQIQAQVAQDGQASRIVTAASFDESGNANLLSYGWTGDTTTVYETQAYLVPGGQLKDTTASLAAQGYFISAFGGNDTYGWILVGARVKGDTLPRTVGWAQPPNNPDTEYFTGVWWIEDTSVGSFDAFEQ